MKKILLYIIFGAYALNGKAQDNKADTTVANAGNTISPVATKIKTHDEILPPFCIELNYKKGLGLSNTLTMRDMASDYKAANSSSVLSNPKIGKITNPSGGDVQFDYYFGKKHLLGIGLGVMYQEQTENLSMSKLNVAYIVTSTQTDSRPFQQNVSLSNGTTIAEQYKTSTVSIPLLLKFRHQFKKEWGVFADAGGVLNVYNVNKINSSSANLDYEATYEYIDGVPVAPNNTAGQYVYLTKENYRPTTQYPTVKDWFNALYKDGYNVYYDTAASLKSAKHSYKTISLGMLLQAGISYQVNYRITADIGGYYMMQVFNSDNSGDPKIITTTLGQYQTPLVAVKKDLVQSYGISVGLKYFIGKDKDSDGDGIPDAKDGCPLQAGLKAFNGCPDTDGDGIMDGDDACPFEAGELCTNGCPDRDHDCVADNKDKCPDIAGSIDFDGCPDTDGDGVPDSYDRCPTVAGSIKMQGCPDTDGDGVADIDDSCVNVAGSPLNFGCPADTLVGGQRALAPHHILLSKKTVDFGSGKATLDDATKKDLDEVIQTLNSKPDIVIFIGGYTDNVGSYTRNMMLSFDRANSVMKYLEEKGIDKKRIMVSGYGKMNPIIDNDTPEHKAKNRRIEMKLLLPLSD